MFDLKKLAHSISLRIPQSYALRSGMRLKTFDKATNSLYWHTFTSDEYLKFIPSLVKSNINPSLFIDCGASVGYVSLLFKHLCQLEVLDWNLSFLLIEPGKLNFGRLCENLTGFGNTPVSLERKLVGKKSGSEVFYEYNNAPWSSSIHDRNRGKAQVISLSYYDLSKMLNQHKCFIKMDIEGGEYEFIKNYKGDLHNLEGLLIEWHLEMGNQIASENELFEAGLKDVNVISSTEDRIVKLYLRN